MRIKLTQVLRKGLLFQGSYLPFLESVEKLYILTILCCKLTVVLQNRQQKRTEVIDEFSISL